MQCINSNRSNNNDEKLLPKRTKTKQWLKELLKEEHYKLLPQEQLIPKKPHIFSVMVTT